MGVERRRENSTIAGLRRTAKQYMRSKIGVIGLAVIVFFLLLAVFAPILTSYPPVTDFNIGAPYAVPAWAVIFPQYSNQSVGNTIPVPAAQWTSGSNFEPWQSVNFPGSNYTVQLSPDNPLNLTSPGSGSLLVNATVQTNQSTALSYGPNVDLPYGQLLYEMSAPFKFDGKVPAVFSASSNIFWVNTTQADNISEVYVAYVITSPTNTYLISSVASYSMSSEIVQYIPGSWQQDIINSSLLLDPSAQLPYFSNINVTNPSAVIFSQAGNYTITMEIMAACSDNPANLYGLTACPSQISLSFLVNQPSLEFYGGAFGLLGTDNVGRSVWSQFVWGSQISLEVGILSAIGSVGIGALAGVTAGYLGGLTDELIGRITDFVLVLPFLPLLIILLLILTRNPLFDSEIYLWIIIIFTLISWPAIARIIRSQVLSVKERPYVEASRSLGGGTWHVLRKHIVPNVMGLVYSQMALSVSGFILTEAALDYLAVSIHPITTMTWGIMLTNALPDATTNSLHSYVWWWFLPPGIAIAALSLSFVLVGFALDSVFNPKLRAR